MKRMQSMLSNFRFQISDLRSEISDLKCQISDLRFRISDFGFLLVFACYLLHARAQAAAVPVAVPATAPTTATATRPTASAPTTAPTANTTPASIVTPATAPSTGLAVRDSDTVLFLGDELIDAFDPRASSNFPFLVETFLTVRYPELKARYVYSGWSGDTAARALLRLDRDVLSRKPTLVVVCLGLNDPDYLPFAEDRLAKFRQNLAALVDGLKAVGARVWLLSPPAVREDLGRTARILRDGQSSLVDLQAIQYNATLARYAAAMGEIATRSGSGFVDWYAASHSRRPSAAVSPALRDGRLPSPESHALAAAQLLEAWRAQPIEVSIEVTWNPARAAIAINGSPAKPVPVEVAADAKRILTIANMPLPWLIPGGRPANLQPDWEAAEMCQYLLRIPDPPARGVTLHQEAPDGGPGGSITLTPEQPRAGYNLAGFEPLRAVRPAQNLLQAIGLKNFYQYSTWRRQELLPPPEPELAPAQRQLVAALYAYSAGYERVVQRLPKTFDAKFTLAEAVRPERLPTATPLSTRPFSFPVASRPITTRPAATLPAATQPATTQSGPARPAASQPTPLRQTDTQPTATRPAAPGGR